MSKKVLSLPSLSRQSLYDVPPIPQPLSIRQISHPKYPSPFPHFIQSEKSLEHAINELKSLTADNLAEKEEALLSISNALNPIKSHSELDSLFSPSPLSSSKSIHAIMDTLNASEFHALKTSKFRLIATSAKLTTACHTIELKISMANLLRQLQKMSFSCEEMGPINEMDRDEFSSASSRSNASETPRNISHSRNAVFEIWDFREHETFLNRLSSFCQTLLSYDLDVPTHEKIDILIKKINTSSESTEEEKTQHTSPSLRKIRQALNQIKSLVTDTELHAAIETILVGLNTAIFGYIKAPYSDSATKEELVVTRLALHLNLKPYIACSGNYESPIELQEKTGFLVTRDPRLFFQRKQPGITLRELMEEKKYNHPKDALKDVPLAVRQKLTLFSLLVGAQDGHTGNVTLQELESTNNIFSFDWEGSFPTGHFGVYKSETYLPFISLFLFDTEALNHPLEPSVIKWVETFFNASLLDPLTWAKLPNGDTELSLLSPEQIAWLQQRNTTIFNHRCERLRDIIDAVFPLTLDIFESIPPEMHLETLQIMQKPLDQVAKLCARWNSTGDIEHKIKTALATHQVFDGTHWLVGLTDNDTVSFHSSSSRHVDSGHESDSDESRSTASKSGSESDDEDKSSSQSSKSSHSHD